MRIRHVKGSEEYVAASPFVIQRPEDHKGRFSKEVFGNDAPIRLEVGMGMGTFIRELAASDPGHNYIGFELNTTVLYKALRRYERQLLGEAGAERAEEAPSALEERDEGGASAERLSAITEATGNLRFIRSDARFLSDYFSEGEIDRIYLNFSDPWPKDKNANKRLTSPVFLEHYKHILKDGGMVEFKTDNRGLFDYSVETFPAAGFEIRTLTYDLHHDPELSKGNIMTEYEAKFSAKGNPICRLTAVYFKK